jgi:hypothetical protein
LGEESLGFGGAVDVADDQDFIAVIGFAVDTDLTQAEFIAPRRMVSWKRRDALLSPSSAIRYKSAALGTNRRGMMLV